MSPTRRTSLLSSSANTEAKVRQWLNEHGDQLYAFALSRVRDASVAEEVVQETFLAALSNAEQFTGESAAATWLTAILRNKIYDYFRRRKRQQLTEVTSDVEHVMDSEDPVDGHRHWQKWSRDPAKALEDKEFWQVFDNCRMQLPPHLAETFVLRELESLATEEVCKILNISSTNLSVRIHRARMLLRKCLEIHWFTRD